MSRTGEVTMRWSPREDFHPQADADPSDLQKAAAEA